MVAPKMVCDFNVGILNVVIIGCLKTCLKMVWYVFERS